MSRTVTVPLGESATLTLLPPLSARQRLSTFGPFWSVLDEVIRTQENSTMTESAQAGLRLEATSAFAVLQMQPEVSVPCPPVERFVAGLYVDAGGPEKAVSDLLEWCEANGVPTADLQAACHQAARHATLPTQAAVDSIKGN